MYSWTKYNWTKAEKEISDSIFERYTNGELSYNEATETAENYGIPGWLYNRYSFNEAVRRYNQDFYKYIGKVKKEALDRFKLTEEDERLLRENPDDISLIKGILPLTDEAIKEIRNSILT
ncbi:hypothetical protein [Clostridium magnum]|uniref:Uncharacterized protein n=1 Tax=Clostridium magnum DSM 2767 TaxID=1121326 RepID=A0A162UNE8_9CLOT|nr:hypothetical protein [Clostridium magnum]KZL94107.1 hypothetical protein CLMAG_11600 [Clostridium magnum DSM 2767]SHH94940.1 hypothetical protein SAMN02745944_01892 [Clostridium magnum DSM 2767]